MADKKIRKIKRAAFNPGTVIPIDKDDLVIMEEGSDECSSGAELAKVKNTIEVLTKQVGNIYDCLSEVVLLTGTGGRILEKYDIKQYVMTAADKKGRLQGQ